MRVLGSSRMLGKKKISEMLGAGVLPRFHKPHRAISLSFPTSPSLSFPWQMLRSSTHKPTSLRFQSGTKGIAQLWGGENPCKPAGKK